MKISHVILTDIPKTMMTQDQKGMKISHIILTDIPKTMMTQDQILEIGVFQTDMMKTMIEVEADVFQADSDMMKKMVKIIHVHIDLIMTILM